MARVSIALAVAVPVLIAAFFVVTAVLSLWMLWAVAGWWFYGYRYRAYHGPGRHRRTHGHDHRHPRRQARGVGPGRGFWT